MIFFAFFIFLLPLTNLTNLLLWHASPNEHAMVSGCFTPSAQCHDGSKERDLVDVVEENCSSNEFAENGDGWGGRESANAKGEEGSQGGDRNRRACFFQAKGHPPLRALVSFGILPSAQHHVCIVYANGECKEWHNGDLH